MDELNYIEDSWKESEKDVREGNTNYRPFEEVLKSLGWPFSPKDPEKEALKHVVDDAKMEYESYCYIKAAKCVRKLLAESGKE